MPRAGGQYSNSILTLNTAQIRTQTYYDDYNWDGLNSLNHDAATSLAPIYANARGLPTGAATYHGTDGQTRYQAIYYDNKGRNIQSRQHNDRGQVEQTDTQYNFVGQPLKMRQQFKPPIGGLGAFNRIYLRPHGAQDGLFSDAQ